MTARISNITGFTIIGGKFEDLTNTDYLILDKVGEKYPSYREGLLIIDSPDFEKKVYEHVNKRLKDLGYV